MKTYGGHVKSISGRAERAASGLSALAKLRACRGMEEYETFARRRLAHLVEAAGMRDIARSTGRPVGGGSSCIRFHGVAVLPPVVRTAGLPALAHLAALSAYARHLTAYPYDSIL